MQFKTFFFIHKEEKFIETTLFFCRLRRMFSKKEVVTFPLLYRNIIKDRKAFKKYGRKHGGLFVILHRLIFCGEKSTGAPAVAASVCFHFSKTFFLPNYSSRKDDVCREKRIREREKQLRAVCCFIYKKRGGDCVC